ncbi:hypothetical protein MALH05_00395 [Mycoplasma anatis]|nr:hypothetical protein [Mycoplasmopsis anatis]
MNKLIISAYLTGWVVGLSTLPPAGVFGFSGVVVPVPLPGVSGLFVPPWVPPPGLTSFFSPPKHDALKSAGVTVAIGNTNFNNFIFFFIT